jgi:hypothetical protein
VQKRFSFFFIEQIVIVGCKLHKTTTTALHCTALTAAAIEPAMCRNRLLGEGMAAAPVPLSSPLAPNQTGQNPNLSCARLPSFYVPFEIVGRTGIQPIGGGKS